MTIVSRTTATATRSIMSSSSKKPSIGIIGAGIGGLTTAHALLKRGFENVKVYEQADKFYPTAGAGFGLGPNGQMCLLSLGLERKQCERMLHKFDSIERLDLQGNIKGSSNVLKEIREEYGFGPQGCLRADLIDLLSKSLQRETKEDEGTLLYSHRMTNIHQDSHKVHVEFDQNGEMVEQEFDLVIGADGINSPVADMLHIDPSPPTYSGANIFYGRIPNPDSIDFHHSLLQNIDHKVINGMGTGEFIMFCVGGEDKKTLIWANTYPSDGPPARTEEWDDILGKQQETLKLLATLLQDNFPSHHPIHELYKHTTPENLLHFGMSYRPHKKEWYKGRVCLLGDACHATLPYIGQGANMALEDAVVLAECVDVESPNYLAAYELYFQRRHLRTKRIVNYGSVMGTLYHTKNPILEWIRELILKSVLKGGVVKNQLVKDIVEECPVDHAQFRKDF